MIKFFRKIRYNLMSENKTGKYLKYAIGEIVLVVIGILIALQINNWNEARKESVLELKILKSLELDLDENTQRIKQMMSSDSILISRNKILIQLLKEDQSSYHDSLRIYFGNINTYFAFFPQVMAYESLKSEGVNLIKNDSLRFSIIKLFDDDYEKNAHTTEVKKDMAMNAYPFLSKQFEMIILDNGWQGGIPNDYESLKGNTELINTISQFSNIKSSFLSRSKSIYENTKATKRLVTDEINKLENK